MELDNELTEWHSSPRRFFGKQIDVTVDDGGVQRPIAFAFDDESHDIKLILHYREDTDFGKGHRGSHRWWQRHHRNYYRVKTTNNELFEIYHDRGASTEHRDVRQWYLTRQF
jgi:hypothetical protein